jgi:hypothetical protein
VDALEILRWVGIVAGLVVVAVLGRVFRPKKRSRLLAEFGQEYGLGFAEDDRFSIVTESFEFLHQGDAPRVSNVLWGVWKGAAIKEADFVCYRKGGKRSEESKLHFNFVLLELDAEVPRVWIRRQEPSLARRMGLRQDLSFESESFNRMFEVQAEDPQGAYRLLDPRLLAWLLETRGAYSFELNGGKALVSIPTGDGNLAVPYLGALLNTAAGFRERIPRLVIVGDATPVELERRDFARANGLSYDPVDRSGLVSAPFELFIAGGREPLTHVVTGRWKGVSLTGGDYEHQVAVVAAEGGIERSVIELSVVVADLPGEFPRLLVQQRSLPTALLEQLEKGNPPEQPKVSRLDAFLERGAAPLRSLLMQRARRKMDRLERREAQILTSPRKGQMASVQMLKRRARARIEKLDPDAFAPKTESPARNMVALVGPDVDESLQVLCEEREPARSLLTRLSEGRLAGLPKPYGFEVAGAKAVLYSRRLQPAEMPALLDAAAHLATRLVAEPPA